MLVWSFFFFPEEKNVLFRWGGGGEDIGVASEEARVHPDNL